MPADDLFPAVGPSGPVVILFLVLVAVLLSWIFFIRWRKNEANRPAFAPVPRLDRERWVASVRHLVESSRGEDVRAQHLALARLMRDITSERTRRDMASWSVGDMARYPQLVPVSRLIGSWEEPSFAPESDATIDASARQAIEVITRW
ncbi:MULTISPECIES: hypothetical protein [unclassified Actinobaculum]|uniref:hypothetical protein n=1 Tax=unclassified Actinobaculum TaxID=2609299 RepID=UPI000D528A1E|nr:MULTISPECIES: hypothetical protein [unclassified Actinobaculum]AWE43202.1 hypothetical protein DDD63_11105 [Actinobaculum sp. 313]MBE6484831.1 hypothetical protein [Actinomycetaceae bacterium]RTE49898.1 hypothetical protein EKN07_05115 [Actinobaculum sp. 352]